MDIIIANSFIKSLKKMRWQNTILYKLYSFLRYKILRFIKNIFYFSKELYRFRSWDSTYNLEILKRSIELTCKNIEKYGYEVDESRIPKIENMKEVVRLLNNIIEDDFYPEAEKELGLTYVGGDFIEKEDENGKKYFSYEGISKKQSNIDRKIFLRTIEIEEESWKKIWQIISDGMRGWWD